MYQPANKKPVMKVKHLHKIPEKKKVWPVMMDEKIDGVYCYIVMRGHDSTLDYRIFSMTGMEYLSMKHISKEFYHLLWHVHDCFNVSDKVVIFEAHVPGQPINVISGLCRDTKQQHPELLAMPHDLIPYEDFIAGRCVTPYKSRRSHADTLADFSDIVTRKPWWWCNDEDEANMYFYEITRDNGGEGVIGRNPQGIWLAGHRRNEDLWKKKIELSYDLLVTGVVQGAGKYAGTLGTLAARFRRFGNDKGEIITITFSGMTDAQRHEWWNDPSKIIGQIVKVDAMTFTKDGLLREPRFKEVRMDKDEADF